MIAEPDDPAKDDTFARTYRFTDVPAAISILSEVVVAEVVAVKEAKSAQVELLDECCTFTVIAPLRVLVVTCK